MNGTTPFFLGARPNPTRLFRDRPLHPRTGEAWTPMLRLGAIATYQINLELTSLLWLIIDVLPDFPRYSGWEVNVLVTQSLSLCTPRADRSQTRAPSVRRSRSKSISSRRAGEAPVVFMALRMKAGSQAGYRTRRMRRGRMSSCGCAGRGSTT